jgi:aspartyl-tRNA(Asn)/glutamyl-tRNA(Gln) amidotransferase subunit B
MARRLEKIERVIPIIGLEVHVALASAGKAFSSGPNAVTCDGAPNTLVDPVSAGLPGALPVVSREAVEMAMRVGLALGCEIAETTHWERKQYFYPDLPKGYQISQLEQPLCTSGRIELPSPDETKPRVVRILRAHLEEDAGRLVHDADDASLIDLNRAGTPLLEIVTAPDLRSADDAVSLAVELRQICRHVGATPGVLEQGHVRFEPNINCELRLRDGGVRRTPIVEIKNLNSFRALGDAIAHELHEQPRRWVEDGREDGPGTKRTHGWDAEHGVTFEQRAKEEAADYRYMPEPDLPSMVIDRAWVDAVRASLPELPSARCARYVHALHLNRMTAEIIVEDPALSRFFDDVVAPVPSSDLVETAQTAATLLLQVGARLAHEQSRSVAHLGISPEQLRELAGLRRSDQISSTAADTLFEALCTSDESALKAAERRQLLQVSDVTSVLGWIDDVLDDDVHAEVIDAVRRGKTSALDVLVGAVMRASGGRADPKIARAELESRLVGIDGRGDASP